eukprot:CAMPEP_0194391070 /NCGR_PEP_ID=MMETSP0174-20130528/113611_1 /TAXON_ID=216777 /ORGANISM="Proboscia alata, Strain PI-D3" /LENGTH=243 /DNA_ID=CAMNT_0039185051 /DNA_START=77 /DNA_END=805 /DNA_ORIENTATION=+
MSTWASSSSHPVNKQRLLHQRRCLGLWIDSSSNRPTRISKKNVNNNMVNDDESSYVVLKPPTPSCSIVIREATEGDLPIVSRILTDGFFRETTNFVTYPIKRLTTFLNLNSRFQTFRFADRTGARYGIFVACHATADGKVVGCCEVDDALPRGENTPAPRPYMCNLAVDEEYRRMGVAGSLVRECERTVRDDWEKTLLHLRMTEGNQVAFDLYVSLGYRVESDYVNAKEERVLLLVKVLDETE